jgi:uracil-DNA glycosylase
MPAPVGLEDNGSDILLVFQSPGEEEWNQGRPLRPTVKIGGTAGRRIEESWDRVKKQRNSQNPIRTDFDIVNTVQCFQGKKPNGGDEEPDAMAICCCSNRLLAVLNLPQKRYTKVIVFGDISQQVMNSLIRRLSPQPIFVPAPHPNMRKKGISTNSLLDDLW